MEEDREDLVELKGLAVEELQAVFSTSGAFSKAAGTNSCWLCFGDVSSTPHPPPPNCPAVIRIYQGDEEGRWRYAGQWGMVFLVSRTPSIGFSQAASLHSEVQRYLRFMRNQHPVTTCGYLTSRQSSRSGRKRCSFTSTITSGDPRSIFLKLMTLWYLLGIPRLLFPAHSKVSTDRVCFRCKFRCPEVRRSSTQALSPIVLFKFLLNPLLGTSQHARVG